MLLLSALSSPSSSFAPPRCPPPMLLCATNAPPIPAALQDALGDERAREVWDRRPPGALPNERKQAALVEWLSTSPLAADPERYLYTCLRREPRLLLKASSLPALRDAHATLSQLLNEEEAPGKFVQAIAHEPALLMASDAALRDAALVIGRVTGLEGAKLARMLRREPGLLLLPPESVERRCEWLRSRLGIEAGGRLSRVISRSPLILLASTATFEARLSLLTDELGVPGDALVRVLCSFGPVAPVALSDSSLTRQASPSSPPPSRPAFCTFAAPSPSPRPLSAGGADCAHAQAAALAAGLDSRPRHMAREHRDCGRRQRARLDRRVPRPPARLLFPLAAGVRGALSMAVGGPRPRG